ncbi:hypothetical protein ABIE26_004649 [Pedobacter africanus]|uniref:Uncharacterized protein n=1 Tax=Pedobacter africanus TaxID=151894 RepID=A0ACC6L375_9SPHI|nr:hypothetical protein [Pedobacter africanus]MDR6785882.1 hypothetical protein [Pedobacter africanus]
MSEKIEFKKLREFGEVISDTVLFIKQNFKALLKVFVYFCGFFIVAGIIASVIQQLGLQGMAKDTGNPFKFARPSEIFTLSYFMVIVFTLFTYTAINVSILSFIVLYIEKQRTAPSPEEVWGYFKYYFVRVFFSGLFVSIFVMVAFLFCILPGVYIFPAMSLFSAVMVMENGSFSYSFSRSFKLLKDQWWVTAGTIFVIWMIAYASMSFASLPAVFLTMAGTFMPISSEWSKVMIVIGTIVQHLCYVFMMIPVIGCTLCYFNLAERQESTGLMDRINQLGQEKDQLSGLEEEY